MEDPDFVFQPLEVEVEMPYSARLKQCKRSPNTGLLVGLIAAGAAGLIYWKVSNTSKPTELPANKVVAESPIAPPKVGDPALAASQEKQPQETLDQESSLERDAATGPLVDSEILPMQEAPDTSIAQDSPPPAPSIEPNAEKISAPAQKSESFLSSLRCFMSLISSPSP